MHAPRFAVATFDKVFDTTPRRDVVTLEQLVAGLTTFQLKPDVLPQLERTLVRIDAAVAAYQAGDPVGGQVGRALADARREARAQGADEHAAVERRAERLRYNARHEVKRAFRLWAPAHYDEGARRGAEGVIHMSALVLDYDQGRLTPADASRAWRGWFHVLHTTWSHTPQKPRFRVIVPYAAPVKGEHHRLVFAWAADRVGAGVLDPAPSGRASAFALPATPSAPTPRLAFAHPGPLLDAHAEGVVPEVAPPPPELPPVPGSAFRGGDPTRRYVPSPPVPTSEEDFDFDF